jgi:23S rRNA (adenine2503-C2)-methyltransferase
MFSPDQTSILLGQTLADFSRARGKHPQSQRPLYQEIFRQGRHINLPAPTRLLRDPADGTVKFTLPVGQVEQGGALKGLESESVIIPMTSYRSTMWYTLCISSQVGCRMACSFCETGRMGLIKNLTPGEIVQQRLVARQLRLQPPPPSSPPAPPADAQDPGFKTQDSAPTAVPQHTYFADGIQNIVFMGMGEPLDNFDNLIGALRVLCEPAGLNFPLAQIAVSTVGRVDGLEKLAALCDREPAFRNLRLAISLNAPTDDLRNVLMPINRAMPLAALKKALRAYPLAPRARFLIEYVLIKDLNDSPAAAKAVAEFCRDLPCVVNVIPYNPQRFAAYETPGEETIGAFIHTLKGEGIFTKRRITHGRDLMSACGQLGNPEIRRQPHRASATALPVLPS